MKLVHVILVLITVVALGIAVFGLIWRDGTNQSLRTNRLVVAKAIAKNVQMYYTNEGKFPTEIQDVLDGEIIRDRDGNPFVLIQVSKNGFEIGILDRGITNSLLNEKWNKRLFEYAE